MTLDIVIVNYNVKHFLRQCLKSVYASDLDFGEGQPSQLRLNVYVVDNASVDGSAQMVREEFPQVRLIANDDNRGFASANNQALRECLNAAEAPAATTLSDNGYVLLLNPDTVVERDTLKKCVLFFLSHPDCGGLTVKMINGEGQYLKESKRGFPTPAAAFYKMTGLIRLFPHSRRVAAYYMGHLPDDEVNPVDILPGAFLMISLPALQKVGLLDESYFMYGEDIDFSWRIRLAGFQNYYMPTARIIHYKGESTRHGSLNYVYTFYNAMSIFVQHYFTGSKARLFNLLLHAAIWLRAIMAWIARVARAVALPVADFGLAFAGFVGLKQMWATYWAANVNYYPPEYTWVVIPLYILALMFCSWLYGGYLKPVRLGRIVQGMAVGSALLLLFYSLLDESLRYSRALLLLGCAWTILSTLGLRGLLSLLHVSGYDLRPSRSRCCLLVGGQEETARVQALYQRMGNIHVETFTQLPPDSLKLADTLRYHKADEVVFCNKDLPIEQIIDLMTALNRLPARTPQPEYKIVPAGGVHIIGTDSVSSPDDLYPDDLHPLGTPLARQGKRFLDIVSALLLLVLCPLLLWWQREPSHYLLHCWQVLWGQKTWVGPDGSGHPHLFVPEMAMPPRATPPSPEVVQRIRLRYLSRYRIGTDLKIILRNLRNI